MEELKVFEMSFYDKRNDYWFRYIVSAKNKEEAKEKFMALGYEGNYSTCLEEIDINFPYQCL